MFASPDPHALRDVEAHPGEAVPAPIRPVAGPDSSADSRQPVKGQDPSGAGGTGQGGSTSNVVPGQDKGVVSRVARTLDWGSHQMLIAFFSFVVMVMSGQVCNVDLQNTQTYLCVGVRGFQVAVGVVSLIVGLIAGLSFWCGMKNQIAMEIISIFQLLWWIAGVIVLTYYGDYQTTQLANGYYGSWAALIFSIFAVVCVAEMFDYGMNKQTTSVRKPLFYLIFASLIVMLSAIGPCSPQNYCSGYNAFAVCLGTISLFISLVLFFFPGMFEKTTMNVIGGILVLWWVLGTLIVTFGAPFTQAGNGFFASYAAIFSSIGVVHVLNRD